MNPTVWLNISDENARDHCPRRIHRTSRWFGAGRSSRTASSGQANLWLRWIRLPGEHRPLPDNEQVCGAGVHRCYTGRHRRHYCEKVPGAELERECLVCYVELSRIRPERESKRGRDAAPFYGCRHQWKTRCDDRQH